LLVAMFGLWGICSPAAVQTQVAPRRYTLGDGDAVPADSPQALVDVVRLKPQPVGDIHHSHILPHTVEEELVLFSSDIRFDSASALREQVFGPDLKAFSCYIVDTTSVKYATPFVRTLRDFLDKYQRSSQARVGDAKVGRSENTTSIGTACRSLAQVLGNTMQSGSAPASDANRTIVANESISSESLCIVAVSGVSSIFLVRLLLMYIIYIVGYTVTGCR
jgi:hypothetical protein